MHDFEGVTEADVVVIGAGGAGLAAASEAAKLGRETNSVRPSLEA